MLGGPYVEGPALRDGASLADERRATVSWRKLWLGVSVLLLPGELRPSRSLGGGQRLLALPRHRRWSKTGYESSEASILQK